jgi:aldehyde:ferredoxin oxidoreductase
VGIRHSHLDNIGYSVDQKAAKKPMDPEKMVNELTKEDDSRGYSTPWWMPLCQVSLYRG